MNWKEHLAKLELDKNWNAAILLMQDVIANDDFNVDAYLSINYLLMNLLVEENYTTEEHDNYEKLLKKYFFDSYNKFCTNPEYLFYIAKIACMSEWYFDLEIEDAKNMMKKAADLEPNYILFSWVNYSFLDMRNSVNRENMILYAKQALSDPKVKKDLQSKGALGKYLWNSLMYWNTLPNGADLQSVR